MIYDVPVECCPLFFFFVSLYFSVLQEGIWINAFYFSTGYFNASTCVNLKLFPPHSCFANGAQSEVFLHWAHFLFVLQELDAAVGEARAMKNQAHLALQAKQAARNMEKDHEEVCAHCEWTYTQVLKYKCAA